MYPDDEISEPQPRIMPEQFLADQKRSIRRKSWWAIGIGSALVAVHVIVFASQYFLDVVFVDENGEPVGSKLFTHSLFFVLGMLATIAGTWGLYYARNLSLNDIIPSREAVEYLQLGEHVRPYFSYALIACIVIVTFVQYSTGLEASISKAGLVKSEVIVGHQYWRILSSTALHGGLLHIYFNSQALFGFGSLFEQLSNRAHLTVVFLLAAVTGGIASVIFMPAGLPSVGASGGIMGLIGYMAVFGYRRKRHLPPDFLKTMLINIAFIGAIGIIGYQLIDNFAHLGGLLAGATYGILQVPTDPHADPRRAGALMTVFGVVCLGIFVVVCLFTISILIGVSPKQA